jgi:hypothetical protein
VLVLRTAINSPILKEFRSCSKIHRCDISSDDCRPRADCPARIWTSCAEFSHYCSPHRLSWSYHFLWNDLCDFRSR